MVLAPSSSGSSLFASVMRSLGNTVSCLCAFEPRRVSSVKQPFPALATPYASEFLPISPESAADGRCSSRSTQCSVGLPTVAEMTALEDMLCSHEERDHVDCDPLHAVEMSGVSLDFVREKFLLEDWAISRLLRDEPRVSSLACSLPMNGPGGGRLDGALVRRSEFVMELPQDLPRAVTALVGMPERSRITQVYALRALDAEEVVLVQQTTSHDVMFGDSFHIRETYSWRLAPTSAGTLVQQRTWSEVWWSSPLFWTYGAIAAVIDSKSKQEATASAAKLARLMSET